MTTVHTRYSEIVSNLTGSIEQQARGVEYLESLERKIKKCKKMLVKTSKKHCYTGVYTLDYHVYDHTD